MTSDSNDAEQRFCTECGHQLEYGVRFCTECGAALTTEPAQKATPVPLTNTPGPNRVVVIGGAVLVVLVLCIVAITVAITMRDGSSSDGATTATAPACAPRTATRVAAQDAKGLRVADTLCIDLSGDDNPEMLVTLHDKGAEDAFEWRTYQVVQGAWKRRATERTWLPIEELQPADAPFEGDLVEWTRQTENRDMAEADMPTQYYGYRRFTWDDHALDAQVGDAQCGSLDKTRALREAGFSSQGNEAMTTCADVTGDAQWDLLVSRNDDEGDLTSEDVWKVDGDGLEKIGSLHSSSPDGFITVDPAADPALITDTRYDNGKGAPVALAWYQWDGSEFEHLTKQQAARAAGHIRTCPDTDPDDFRGNLRARGASCREAEQIMRALARAYEDSSLSYMLSYTTQPRLKVDDAPWECLQVAQFYEGSETQCAAKDATIWFSGGA